MGIITKKEEESTNSHISKDIAVTKLDKVQKLLQYKQGDVGVRIVHLDHSFNICSGQNGNKQPWQMLPSIDITLKDHNI